MQRKVTQPARIGGEVLPPGDKSISHRALILNALGEGTARVRNISPGLDCRASADCLRGLGVPIEDVSETEVVIEGRGRGGFVEPADVLSAENSGTTMRLLSGVLAGQPFFTILSGDASLRSRPMARIAEPLRLMGAQVWGRRSDTLAPLAIKGGNLHGIDYTLPVASAQVKSALLLAALYADSPTTLHSPAPSRDHTERMLTAMGATIEGGGATMRLEPPRQPLKCVNITVPADLSSGAFWMVAGAVHPNARIVITGVGINPTRRGIVDVLAEMGAHIHVVNERLEGGEEVADIVVESSRLRGVEIGGDIIPNIQDEVPVLAVAAALAAGTTVIRDAAELRVKESDRIATTARELSRFGAAIEERPDGMVIRGVAGLRGATCASHGDHRLAMTLAVAGLVASGETVIAEAEAVAVSYPGFWDDLDRLTGAR